ncbi:UDP-galactose 4-epimerase [Streptomyces sp. SLBN-118]|uniref:UDP-glucose 4-epimerase GalE n=1 Tax=Streptomyces sp. SLBN-118 TaxID=2768454 RepID=UPI001150EDF7|nr:UDP-glucose 4-epimerase GalE [Streptomyces sp. SLBN-118]TQK50806.1 UDP-galactose 4-epimerase [Streptomyces sp. SLBN-118]
MPEPSIVLVTGGAGFIGSHTCVELLDHGYEVVVVDDYSHSSPLACTRIQRIAGRRLAGVYAVDIRDRRALSAIFHQHRVDAVVHLAGKRSVDESLQMPIEYYDVNVGGTTSLLSVMQEHGVSRLVFSSSCSIYGKADGAPLTENAPADPATPSAASKWVCEQMLADVCRLLPEFTVLTLRHFNPVGAHPSGLLGQDSRGEPDHLMPRMARVAAGRHVRLSVFGGDYDTSDGTVIRDFIHVMDLADAHRSALEHLADRRGLRVFNLGGGSGTTVLELLAAFGEATGTSIPYEVVDRRPGDASRLVADASAAAREWGWQPTRDLAAMCRDAWRFQQINPTGYTSET